MSDKREDQQIIELLQRCLNQLTNINLSTNLIGELIQEVHAGNELLKILIGKETQMAASLDDVKQDVTDQTTVVQSAVTLLNGLAAQIAASKNDPAAIQAIADGITSNSSALAAAVTANTPAAPAA